MKKEERGRKNFFTKEKKGMRSCRQVGAEKDRHGSGEAPVTGKREETKKGKALVRPFPFSFHCVLSVGR